MKSDIANLAQQITDAVKALREAAEFQTQRTMREARGQVGAMASEATDRAVSVANSAGGRLADAVQERPVLLIGLAIGIGFLVGFGWRR